MRSFKTPKGTELSLLDLRGKDYLQVAHRLVWFREERPDWSIITELVQINVDSCLAKAYIRDDKSNLMGTAHKFETAKGFPDFIEKSETGAIGRALALCGFGTQFCADDLDEGERLADSPVSSYQPPTQESKPTVPRFKVPASVNLNASPGEVVCPFGKAKGNKIKDLGLDGTMSALDWVETKAAPGYRAKPEIQAFIKAAKEYLGHSDAPPAAPMPTEKDLIPFDESEELPF